MLMTLIGHASGYNAIGRTEVEPMPADPDFKSSGVWSRKAAYPFMSPEDIRGFGLVRYRYWEPDHGDDSWVYISSSRRVRRLREGILNSSAGLMTWGAAHAGGFGTEPPGYK